MQFPNMLFLWICYNQIVNYFLFYPNISTCYSLNILVIPQTRIFHNQENWCYEIGFNLDLKLWRFLKKSNHMKCGWKEEFFIRLLISQCNKNHFLPHYLTAFHTERAKVIDLDDKSTTYTSIKALGP